MSIERVGHNSAITIGIGGAVDNFYINAVRKLDPPDGYLTELDIQAEATRLLEKPPTRRTFLIGPFSTRCDPLTGILPQEDQELIEAIHEYYEESGIECHSSFRRENYGRRGIRPDHANLLDRLAIHTSHVITVLPGSSRSQGAWEEIRYAGGFKRSFLFLFRKGGPELKFQETIRTLIANLATRPPIVFVIFKDLPDLLKQMDEVWKLVRNVETTEGSWKKDIEWLKRDFEFKRLFLS